MKYTCIKKPQIKKQLNWNELQCDTNYNELCNKD